MAWLLIYVWLDEYWLPPTTCPTTTAPPRRFRACASASDPASAIVGAVLVALAIAYKKLVSDSPEGFPGYFTFIVGLSFIPSAGLFPSARGFVNWPAFSLTMFPMVLISLIWERKSLAIPYGWWGVTGARWSASASTPGSACRSRPCSCGSHVATRR